MADSMSELGRAALDYVSMGLAVVPLRPRSKEPATAHGLRDWTDDPDSVREVWGAHPDLNVGIVCGAPSGGLVAIDLDCHEDGPDGMASLREWELAHGDLPETCTAVTGSGGLHMLYRADGEVRPSANAGLGVDVRGDGSYIVAPPSVHPNGRRYEWEVPPDELAPQPATGAVMAFVAHVRPSGALGEGRRLEVPDAIGEGGRNDALYRIGCSMRAKGLSPDVIADALAGVNAARCRPPLPADEVAAVARSVAERPAGRSAEWEESHGARGGGEDDGGEGGGEPQDAPPWLDGRGRLVHDAMARTLVDELGACRVDSPSGMLAVWDEARGRWALGARGVAGVIISLHERSRMAERREVISYLEAVAPVRRQAPPELVAFRNGVLDITTMEFRPMTRDDLIANVVPHDWDPSATSPELDALLARLADGDDATLVNLAEVAGACLYRSNCYAQSPVLLGSGSNGKSTYLKLLKAMLGPENYSTLDLSEMGEHFQAEQLAGKLANIGDDISNEFARGDVLSVFKKVTSGEDVYTDVKGGQGYHFRPYCTVMFSANEFPKLGDHGDGMERRLFPLRFRARFTRGGPGYDPHVLDKVTTERAMSALLNLAVSGLASVMGQNGFTPNADSERLCHDIRVDNDTVLQWLEDEDATAAAIGGRPTASVYADYAAWCRACGCKQVKHRTFTQRVCEARGLACAVRWVPEAAKSVRAFVTPKGGA